MDRETAIRVYIRDDWRCRHCRSRENLHAHHLQYRSHGGEDKLYNLITLCYRCHREHHDGRLGIEWTKTGKGVIIKFNRK